MESLTSVLISLYHPFPRTLSLSLPSSTPVSTLASYLPLPSSSSSDAQHLLQYSTGRSLPSPSSAATLSQLTNASTGFVALRLSVRLQGGKGGFASQLRAQGGRMSSNKAQNTDSCRGLDGRRLSTIKEAQKIAKLLESEPDRLAAAALQKQAKLDELNAEIAKLERQSGVEPSPVAPTSFSSSSAAVAGPSIGGGKQERKPTGGAGGAGGGVKRRLDDQKYVEQSRQITEGVKDAVRAAMLKKRKKNKPAAAATAEGEETAAVPAAKENAAPAKKDVKGKGKAKAVAQDEEEGEAEVEQ